MSSIHGRDPRALAAFGEERHDHVGDVLAAPQSDRFYALLHEVRRSQRSYQRSGHSPVPQKTAIVTRAGAAIYQIDLCWRDGALDRYDLLRNTAGLSVREFRQEIVKAKTGESDKKLLKSLKLLQLDREDVMDANTFQDIPLSWATHRMNVIDSTAEGSKQSRAVRSRLRKEARNGSLSNIAACYLVLRVEEGLRDSKSLLEIASAALSIPH